MSEVKPPPSEPGKPTRAYRSPRREAQARATRAAVVAAAQARFSAVGYGATTVDAVAADADVSAATVYSTFGSKRALFEAAIDQSIVGDSESLALADRTWVTDLATIDDPKEQLRFLYRSLRAVYERTAALDRAIEEAAGSDPELVGLLEQHRRAQQEDTEQFRDLVTAGRPIFASLDAQQDVEALWALGGQAVYRRLTDGCGWTPEQWEAWMVELVGRLLDTMPASER